MKDILWWVNLIYCMPLYVSALYFTILKIEDKNRTNKVFSKDKLSYKIIIRLCFVPILNIIFMFVAIKSCFKK